MERRQKKMKKEEVTSKAVLLPQRQISKKSILTDTRTSNIKNYEKIMNSRKKSKDRCKKM